jgi:hypothetical protein
MLCEQCESTNTTDVNGHVKCQEHHIESQYLEMKYHLD